MYCRKCGVEILDDSLYCPRCGAIIDGSIPSNWVKTPEYAAPSVSGKEGGLSYNIAFLICFAITFLVTIILGWLIAIILLLVVVPIIYLVNKGTVNQGAAAYSIFGGIIGIAIALILSLLLTMSLI